MKHFRLDGISNFFMFCFRLAGWRMSIFSIACVHFVSFDETGSERLWYFGRENFRVSNIDATLFETQ